MSFFLMSQSIDTCPDSELIAVPKISHIQGIATLFNLPEAILDLAQASH